MTVKVSKPAINVREELADLKKPTGIAGQAMLAAETPQEQFNLIGAGRRNIVHNGDMRISQKAGGAAVTAHGTTNSPVDRFQVTENHSGGISWEQVQDAPKGFYHSIKSTVTSTDTSLASTEYARIFTRIEGQDISHLNWGTANAKPLTLSFWVKSSVTGTFDIAVGNGAGNKTLIIPYTIDSTNTWEYKTMLITPETTGTWATDNTLGLHLGWSLGSGSTYYTTVLSPTWIGSFAIGSSNGTNLAATNGATFYLTGVQLEVGPATPFEHRSYSEELALCQRYFQRLKFNGGYTKVCLQYGTTSGLFTIEYSTKRSIPTIVTLPTPTTSTNQVNGISLLTSSGSYRSATGSETVTASHISEDTCRINLAGFAASGSAGDATWGYFTTTSNPSGCHIDVQAEL
jgi:hypothetical protein